MLKANCGQDLSKYTKKGGSYCIVIVFQERVTVHIFFNYLHAAFLFINRGQDTEIREGG